MAEKIDPDYVIDWYRVPLPKEQLAALNERSDLKGWLQSGGFLATMLATAALSVMAYNHHAWGWLALALFLHGTVCSFCINAVHELVHGTVFKTKVLNDVFAEIFAFVGWIDHRGFWASHSEHHRYTLHTPHDQEVIVPISLHVKGLHRTIFDYRAIKWTLKHHWARANGKLSGDWDTHLLTDSPVHAKVVRWSRILLIGHGLIIFLSLCYGLWLVPVLLTLTPLYGKTLFFFLNNTQHVGLQAHVNDFRLNCRSFHTNPVYQFLYWHMNYHIEHHMYAAVPCYNLKKLNKAVSHELPYVWDGLVEMWWHIIAVLYRQKHEPGYVFVPALPGDPAEDVAQAPGADLAPVAPSSVVVDGQVAAPTEDVEAAYMLWECSVCGFIYDEKMGQPDEGVAPGTRWDDLPEDWACPDCGVGRDEFANASPVSSVA